MQRPLLSVYDSKTGLYDPPFSVRHVGEAMREVDILKADTQTKFGKNPADFTLRQIGTFDEETGLLTPTTPPTDLA